MIVSAEPPRLQMASDRDRWNLDCGGVLSLGPWRHPLIIEGKPSLAMGVIETGEGSRMLQETDLVNVDDFALHSATRVWWRFEVSRGQRIKGLVTGSDNFEFALLDELQFATWHRGEKTEALEGGAARNSYAFDRVARSRDTWYVGLSTRAWLSPLKVSIHVRRLPH